MMLIESSNRMVWQYLRHRFFWHGGFACQFNFAIENQGYQFPGEFDLKTVGIMSLIISTTISELQHH